MSGPTILCACVATACLTLAVVHLLIWSKNRAAAANLAFSLLAAGVALFTWCCLLMMRASTPSGFAWALWWSNATVLLMVAGVVAFVNSYFRTARRWLGHSAWLLRLMTFAAHVVRFPNSDFDSISALQSVGFLGEAVSVAVGDLSIWYWTGQASLLVLLSFVIDACYRQWSVGTPVEKHHAVVIGLPTVGFVLLGGASAALIFGGFVAWPHLEFIPFLAMLMAMAYELSSDVLRAARLTAELQASEAALRESDRRMTIATAAAHELSGRLINAQEEERRRIARDLHDDLSQRLSVLSVDLELLGRSHGRRDGVAQLASQVQELSSEVHKVAYQLHPAKLDQLGLEIAARGWCRDVTQQSGVHVQFAASSVPQDIPGDVALCLYRVIQEALRNVVKHSQSPTARVELRAGGQALHLLVSDTGRGFAAGAGATGGLGLLSMRERTHLLKGTLEVDSRPGAGTRVRVSIPLPEAGN